MHYEYKIVCQGRYGDMEWIVIKYTTAKYNGLRYSGRVKPLFLIGSEWHRMDRVQPCILSDYNEYISNDVATRDEAKAAVRRMIDFLWTVDVDKRISMNRTISPIA
jgi:hypothetical protein